jgi:L-ascorbate metabolism protein UlaG (beta-lactamase superfamily)
MRQWAVCALCADCPFTGKPARRKEMHPYKTLVVPEGALGIHWFGQSSFALKDAAGLIVQVDPYFPHERPQERYIHAKPPLDEAALPTEVVLLTHNHSDHTHVETLGRILKAYPSCHIIGPAESLQNLQENNLQPRNSTTVSAGDEVQSGTVTVHVVWAKPPGGAPADNIKAPDVAHLGFVVEIGGTRVYISGDPINTFANYDELTQPIARLQPDIGFFTTHPTEGEFPFFDGSVKMVQRTGVKTAVPAHYQCFVKRNYDPADWDAQFPSDEVERLIIPYNSSVIYRKR